MEQPQPDTQRKLGLWMSMALVVGNMIGSGVFFLPASLGAYGGISIMGWIFSAIGALFLALVFSKLSREIPGLSGGPYVYTRAEFGEFAGFLVAWGYWISIWCTNAGIAVALVSYLSVFIPVLAVDPLLAVLVGLGLIWLLTWVNTRGVQAAGKMQLITTILKILPLLIIAVGGLFYLDPGNFVPFNLSGESGFSAVTATATLTLFAFLGLECATIPAGDVEDPENTIPKATMWGTVITIIIYILGTVAVMGIIPPQDLQTSSAPFADAAARIWGNGARELIAAGVIISTFGALNGWILIQGQIPMAAARDRLFPPIFKKENRRGMPAVGIAISSILVSILMIMNFTKGLAEAFKFMILLSTLTVLIPYIFSAAALSLISFRNKKLSKKKLLVNIIAASIAFGFSLWAMAGSGQETVYWGFILLMAGIPFYVWLKKGEKTADPPPEH
ncbi:MAG: amino acid permease [Saprospiraceae bacterium]|nr:amino acid permease [Lewinella sp.]